MQCHESHSLQPDHDDLQKKNNNNINVAITRFNLDSDFSRTESSV